MTDAHVVFEDVAHAFYQPRLHRRTPVLDAVSFEVRRGEFVAVVGPSGCGKTTLLHVAHGLLKPDAGRVLVEGRPIDGPSPDRAVVFQEAALLPWRTALGNVAYGLECLALPVGTARARAGEWLVRVGLDGFGDHYPHELSGGMEQRVNVARALAIDPAILLMDEPFSSLDALTRESMQADLLAACAHASRTVVFVTHDPSEAVFLADRVVVLTPRPGRVQGSVSIPLERPRAHALRLGGPFRELERAVRMLLAAGAR